MSFSDSAASAHHVAVLPDLVGEATRTPVEPDYLDRLTDTMLRARGAASD